MLLAPLALLFAVTQPPVVEVGVGRHFSCARTVPGDIACWGHGQRRPTTVEGLSQVVDLEVSEKHACVVRDDGAVFCWGENAAGQLGDGTTITRDAPVPVIGVQGAVEVVVDRFHSCARLGSGHVECWGGGAQAGTNEPQLLPNRMRRLTGVTRLMAGGDATCAQKADQSTWCWGFNGTGLFLNTAGPVLRPRRVDWLLAMNELALGDRHGCVRLHNLPKTKGREERRSSGVTFCFGDDSQGALGDQTVPDYARCSVKTSASQMSEVICRWTPRPPPPEREDPKLPRPDIWPPPERPAIVPEVRTFPARQWPIAADAMHVHGLVASSYRTCGIGQSGAVECWGDSFEVPAWSHRRRSEVAGTRGALSVAIADYHGCAVFEDATVRCWGQNEQGALGDGSTESRDTAEPVLWE
jgi:alpha-tubulin suppressor-like RCC1 family protein